MTDKQATADEYRAKSESFQKLFKEYDDEDRRPVPRWSPLDELRRRERLDELRANLQRLEPQIARILLDVMGVKQHLVADALLGGNLGNVVCSYLNRALGTLEAGLWPPKERTPVLVIYDDELKARCTDLLAAPGNYDRVIREATTILEDRIRRKVSHELLARLIPNAADQTGENLASRIFSPKEPILVISSDQKIRLALHRMLLGVVSYLRNPSHHHLDPNTEWSWAWSTVGLIDRLLADINNCTLAPPGGDNSAP